MNPLSLEDLADLFDSVPSNNGKTILISTAMRDRIRAILSRLHRRDNRAAKMRRRRAIGRGRW